MTGKTLNPTESKAALIAGLGLLAMTGPAIFANMVLFRQLMVHNDAAATAANIIASGVVFRAAVFGMLFVLICDVVVAWALYTLFRPVSATLSLLTAWFRIVYTAILGIAISCLVVVLMLLSNAEYLSVFEPGHVHAYVLMLFKAYYQIWGVGLILFGVHLLSLGVLSLKSGGVPKILGVLLVLGGMGYTGEYSGRFLFPGFNVPLGLVGVGELVFMVWLLWAGRPSRWSSKAV